MGTAFNILNALFITDKRLAAKPSSFDSTAVLGDLLKNVQLNDLMEDDNVTGPSVRPDVEGASRVNPKGPDAIKEAVESVVKSVRIIIMQYCSGLPFFAKPYIIALFKDLCR